MNSTGRKIATKHTSLVASDITGNGALELQVKTNMHFLRHHVLFHLFVRPLAKMTCGYLGCGQMEVQCVFVCSGHYYS